MAKKQAHTSHQLSAAAGDAQHLAGLATKPGEKSGLELDDGGADRLFFAVVMAGIVLRLFHYFHCRSMWFDEACLSLNIVRRGFGALTTPLDFHQAAPVGFLWLERAIVLLLGDGEWSLRFLLVVSGVISLLLFASIVRAVLPPRGALISILLFGFSWPLVRFATEVKPYAVDSLVAVGVLWMVLRAERKRLGILNAVAFGVGGGLLIWCSFPAVFLLVGAALTLGLRAVLLRDRTTLGWILATGGMWAVSGLICYVIVLRTLGGDSHFAEFWHATFMPLPPWSIEWCRWMLNTGGAVFRSTLGLPFSIAGVAAGAFGTISLVRRRPVVVAFLLSPLLLALIASAFGRYPFTGRFLLFATPALFLLMGEGTAWILRPGRSRGTVLLGWLIVGALVVQPLALAVEHVVRPGAPQEIKPVLVQVREQMAPDDILIVDRALLCPYLYYRERFQLAGVRYRVVKPPPPGRQASVVLSEAVAVGPVGDQLWLLLSDLGELDPAEVGLQLAAGTDRVFECSEAARAPGVVLFRCLRDSEAQAAKETRYSNLVYGLWAGGR